ncbi:hypothetical protein QBC45DRAFT_61090 [Copromyces sp. CBS 386.78]|nr:hypothetical protein QBC45DRAFT_61090 [Copromyces sp. CBS 386.78]
MKDEEVKDDLSEGGRKNWRCRSSKACGWNGDCGCFSAVLGGDSGRGSRGKPRYDACLQGPISVGQLGKEQLGTGPCDLGNEAASFRFLFGNSKERKRGNGKLKNLKWMVENSKTWHIWHRRCFHCVKTVPILVRRGPLGVGIEGRASASARKNDVVSDYRDKGTITFAPCTCVPAPSDLEPFRTALSPYRLRNDAVIGRFSCTGKDDWTIAFLEQFCPLSQLLCLIACLCSLLHQCTVPHTWPL